MRIKIRHLIIRKGKGGRMKYWWQPSTSLRAAGFGPSAPTYDLAAAIETAEAMNKRADAWRAGQLAAVEAEGLRAQPDTVGALIDGYKASRHWARLAPRTRRGYDQCLAILRDWAGAAPLAAITPRRVEALYASMYETRPSYANAVLRVARILFAFAVADERIADNPARKIRMAGVKSAAGRIWTAAEVEAFAAAADARGFTSIATAVAINYWLGQRPSDVRELPRDAVAADGMIRLTQSKTGARVALPAGAVPVIAARLAADRRAWSDRRIHPTTLIADERTGGAYTENAFRRRFDVIRAQAAAGRPEMRDIQFRHLRHTAVTRLAEAGCTTPEIAAITGHSLAGVDQILERYLVRTETLARRAFAKRLAAESIEGSER
jgi:integrase